MAEINFGLLDTQLPGRIATIPLQAQEAGQANALRTMQMMQGMSQNRLSDLNYNEQMRGIEEQKQIRSALSGIDVTTPQGQNEAVSRATRINPDTGFKLGKMFQDAEKSRADLLKTRAETDKIGFDRATKDREQFAGELRQLALNPTDENVQAVFSKGIRFGVPMQDIATDQARILALPLDQRARTLAAYGAHAADMMNTLKTTTRTTNLGNISRDQTVDFFGRPVGEPTDTPIGISANTAATIAAARKNHLENLAQQGWTFDSDRGLAVNAKLGISRPISTLMSPVGGGVPAAPSGVAAPAVPGVAGGGVPGQRQAPAGQPAAGVLGPKPEKATESYLKEVKGVINTNDAINNLKQMVINFTPSDMVNPSRRAEIDTAHKTAVLLSKEMFNLGVLNGGDQKILEQIIPDPIAFSKGLVPIETIRKNLDAASNVVNRMNQTLSRVHKQPLLSLDAGTPNAPNPSAPPIQSFRRKD